MEVIPAIDVLGESAVRLHQGDFDDSTGFGEPVELARRFSSAAWVHVVDLDGARSGRLRPELFRELATAAMPAKLQASGGIRSPTDAETLLDAGAARVVVGTAAFGGELGAFVELLGERLVVALDIRDGAVRTTGWTEGGIPLDYAIDLCRRAGVHRLLCTAIERDGTLEGPNVALVARVVDRSGLPVLAAGGIRDQADVDALARAGAEGAVVGRALLEGRLSLSPPA